MSRCTQRTKWNMNKLPLNVGYLSDSFVPIRSTKDQRPLVSTAHSELSFHVDRSSVEIFSSCILDLHQFTISSEIYSLHGLPILLIPSVMSNTNAFSFLHEQGYWILHSVVNLRQVSFPRPSSLASKWNVAEKSRHRHILLWRQRRQ